MTDSLSGENPSGLQSVMITGGSGLIGKYLTSLLVSNGYSVAHLSRKGRYQGNIRVFQWDPERGTVDPSVFNGITCLIHLAGANIGEKRWTNARKAEIIRSRVDSANLLYRVISENGIPLKTFISASATGFYGSTTSDRIFTEDDSPANDFLGNTCRLWEEAASLFEASGIRTVRIRTAVVIEKSDSALSKLMAAARFGFLVKTGSGSQYMPWIHISDLCNIYLKAINDHEMKGAYNAVSPQHVTHTEFMKTLARVMKMPAFMPSVPSFLLKAILGEMSDVVLKGSRVSSSRIINSGYRFSFGSLQDALYDVICNQ
jgi:uncharacterized protein